MGLALRGSVYDKLRIASLFAGLIARPTYTMPAV